MSEETSQTTPEAQFRLSAAYPFIQCVKHSQGFGKTVLFKLYFWQKLSRVIFLQENQEFCSWSVNTVA